MAVTHSDTHKADVEDLPRADDEGDSAGKPKRKTLNVPFLAGTLVAAVVFGAAAYAWRSYSVARMANVFVEKAEALERGGDWDKAAGYLRQYLGLRPHDADGLARLARIYDRPGRPVWEKARAVEVYYRAIGALGEDGPIDRKYRLRARLAELLLEVSPVYRGSSTRAEQEARLLLEPPDRAEAWQQLRAERPGLPAAPPEDELWWMDYPELWADARGARLWVLALDRQIKDGSFAGGALPDPPYGEHFEQAVRLNAGDIELSTVVARLFRDQPRLFGEDRPGLSDDQRKRLADGRAERADAIEDAMVAAHPESPEAHLARYQYRVDYGLPGAAKDLDKALKLGPESGPVLVAAARDARSEAARLRKERAKPEDVDAKYAEASAFCRRAIRAAPSEEGGYLLLGEVCGAQGDNAGAIEAWRRGLEHSGQNSLALNSRLMEALVADGRLEEAKRHLDAVERGANTLAPFLERGSQFVLGGMRDLLRGEWLVGQGRYGEAVRLLKRVTAGRQDSDLSRLQVRQAWHLLGGVRARLGQWDLAATAHEQAARLVPEDRPPDTRTGDLVAAAGAWQTAGLPEKAAGDYRQVLDLDDNPETWLALAVARLQVQSRLPPGEREWDPFDEALSEAKARRESLSEPWRLSLVEADALVVKSRAAGQPNEAVGQAIDLLRQAESQYPDSERLLETLAPAYENLGLPTDADRAMDAAERLAGPGAALCILRSRLYAHRREYDKARQVLVGGLEGLDPAARGDLQRALVQVSLDEGRLEAAYRQLREHHKTAPTDVRLVGRLAELALERNDLAEAARWEDKLRALEGPDGSCWRCARGRRLLAEATDADDPCLAEVGELQAYLESQRPAWPDGYVLAGLHAERLGRYQQAIDGYRQAIERGERRVAVYERLIALLYRKRDFDQAQRYLRLMERGDQVASSPTLSGMEVSVAAELGDNARAIEAARRGVESRPQDPMARIWLGRMLLRTGRQTEEAEAALLEALRLAPDDPRTSEAVFAFYADTGQAARAAEALKRHAATAEFSEAERILTLAKGYERIGDRELAKKYYAQAAQQPVDDLAVQKRLAAFLLESDPQGAEQALRRALPLAPEDREVRRALAYLLANRGGAREWQEAQQLMAHGGQGRGATSQDQRLEAQLLLRRDGKENLSRAKQLLEQLVRDPEAATPVDHLLLAGLCEREGKTHLAQQQYEVLAKRAKPEPAHLTAYVEFLVRHGRLREAERALDQLDDMLPDWLARLRQQAPARADSVGVRARLDAARLRASWLLAEGRRPEIKPRVEQLAADLLKQVGNDPEGKAGVYAGVGDIYSAVDEHREAESWYRLLVEVKPESYEPLAACHARQGRIDEAMETCVQAARSDDSARPAIVMAKVLARARPSGEDWARAEPFLSKAVAEHADDAELLSVVAYVRFLQKRNDEAVRLYEQVLDSNPRDLLALNNLATLLAEQPARRKDALFHIQKAIAVAGPRPGFLDVQGTILVLDGKADEAVPLLEEASSLASDPRYAFHLALAYQRTGDPDRAREALGKAREGGLADRALTETDQRLLAELEKELAR